MQLFVYKQWMWAKDVVPTCFSSPPASSPSSAAAASSSMLSQYVMGALPIPLEEEEDQSISVVGGSPSFVDVTVEDGRKRNRRQEIGEMQR
mmetsp:Transcript_85432/g.241863  ORF Transcript_85432/g.241863 Transcript_85432/m.241863 type:complete len:91 (-) Transcript_85432:343-615(-)